MFNPENLISLISLGIFIFLYIKAIKKGEKIIELQSNLIKNLVGELEKMKKVSEIFACHLKICPKGLSTEDIDMVTKFRDQLFKQNQVDVNGVMGER